MQVCSQMEVLATAKTVGNMTCIETMYLILTDEGIPLTCPVTLEIYSTLTHSKVNGKF